eukprot:24914-Eustigmatos_ZCMA.PRE.1
MQARDHLKRLSLTSPPHTDPPNAPNATAAPIGTIIIITIVFIAARHIRGSHHRDAGLVGGREAQA